jgi:hypothetical protein
MRRAVLLAAAAVLLAGPTALAFFSGGYFEGPRYVGTLVAWILVLLAAAAAAQPLPESRPGRIALAGLGLIVVLTGASLAWAPLSEPAMANLVRTLMYLGAFLAAAALLRDRAVLGLLEPGLGFGALVVIGYGLAGRLLPGVVEQAQSAAAFGRLEQPLTYWNAEGALAAIGLVLCTRLAGSTSRPLPVRVLGAAACAPLGLGIYLSYSRGAMAAAALGLVVLLALAPTRAQLRAGVIALASAVIVSVAGSAFPEVALARGSVSEREPEGALMLLILLIVSLLAALLQWRVCRREVRGGGDQAVPFARRLPALAGLAVALGVLGLVVGGLRERGGVERLDAKRGAARLASFESRRYDYWRVGVRAFAQHPIAGVGSGGFRVEWLRERPVAEATKEVHSLPLELAAELGLLGLLALGLLAGATAGTARRALAGDRSVAAGSCAAITVWALHAAIDWDWQMPAVTLPAVVMAGALVAASETAGLARPERVQPPDRTGSLA